MLKLELIKLAKNKQKEFTVEDYKKIPGLHRFGYSLGAHIFSSSLASPLMLYSESSLTDFINKLGPGSGKLGTYLEIFGNLGKSGIAIGQLMSALSSPDSKSSKYAPVVGAALSVPLLYEVIRKAPSKLPAALIMSGTAIGSPYLTRKLKQYFYKRALQKNKNKK